MPKIQWPIKPVNCICPMTMNEGNGGLGHPDDGKFYLWAQANCPLHSIFAGEYREIPIAHDGNGVPEIDGRREPVNTKTKE